MIPFLASLSAIALILGTWLLVPTMFAAHYAHLYYLADEGARIIFVPFCTDSREAYMRVCEDDHPDAETARSRYRTLAASDHGAVVELEPLTGRMHQLRVHMAHLGRPLIGDVRYGGALTTPVGPAPRLMLHAAWKSLLGRKVRLLMSTFAIVIGVVWAVAMNLAKWVERTTFPYAVILQSIPILAVVPLIGFWFGYDFIARTIVCVLIALFPIVSNTLFGLQSVDRGARELFQLQKATRWIVLRKLELPTALPAMFAGMRISAGLSIVGAIVGDFFFQRGTPGIGALIAKYQSRLQSPELFASILLASLFGVAIFLFFGWLARRAVGKWYDFG